MYREYQTNARIYVLHHAKNAECVWLGQSLPRIWREAQERNLRFHLSSCYRIIRGQAAARQTQGVVVHCVGTAEEINEILDRVRAPRLAVMLRDPDNWEMRDTNDDSDSEKEAWDTCKASDSALAQPENSSGATQAA